MSENPTARPEGAALPVGERAVTAATSAATIPVAPKTMCMICDFREATIVKALGTNAKGKRLKIRFCDQCVPGFLTGTDGASNGRKPRKKTKNRIATTDYSETISAILYRVAGCTLEQAGRFLWLYMPDQFETEEAAYEAARRTLLVMREQRQVEAKSIRRLWLGDLKRHGRRENFFRLSTARAGAAIIEGAVAADEDPVSALTAYRRPWKSGGLDHCSHRSDLYLLLAEEAMAREDVRLDVEGMMSETHPDFPYRGAKLPEVDAGGEKLVGLKKTARRKYEEVTPDGEFAVGFEVPVGDASKWLEAPFLLELERRTNAGEVEKKLQKIAGYWARRLDKFRENMVRPVIVVHHDTREARAMGRKPGTGAESMRDTLRERLLGGAATLPQNKLHFLKFDERLRKESGGHIAIVPGFLGRFVLFCEWEDIHGSGDPYGAHYYPLTPYSFEQSKGFAEEDGMKVSLAAAAIQQTIINNVLGRGVQG